MTLMDIVDAVHDLLPEMKRCAYENVPAPAWLHDRLNKLTQGLLALSRDDLEECGVPDAVKLAAQLLTLLQTFQLTHPSETGEDGEPEEDQADESFGEIRKLHVLLEQAGIPHKFQPHHLGSGWQLVYYGHKGPPAPEPGHTRGLGWGSVVSAIQTPFSYGIEKGLIEVQGLGEVTAPEAFEHIRGHWEGEEA